MVKTGVQSDFDKAVGTLVFKSKVLVSDDTYDMIGYRIGESIASNLEKKLESEEVIDAIDNSIQILKDQETQAKNKENAQSWMSSAKSGMQSAEHNLQKLLNIGVSTIQSIYQKMVQSSPLLQSVESLFNLAMQLFFMPLGTKLATVMLPAVLELVDGVMEIWDGFEGKSLGELLTDAMDLGISLLGKYFNNIGDALQTQGGTVASIGKLLSSLGSFIQSDFFSTLVNAFTTLIGWVADFFPQIVGLITSFMIMERVIGLAQIAATADKTGLAGLIVGVGAAAAVGGGVAAGSAFAATGGYFPAVDGGTLVTVSEGGEGEYIVPESKKNLFAESVASANLRRNGGESPQITYNITVNGYTDTDLTDKIKDAMNDQVSASNYRRGF